MKLAFVIRRLVVALCLICPTVFAADHSDHDKTPAGVVLGHLSFPTSTDSKQAQAAFERGMLWLHLFEYEHAVAEFQQAQKLDSQFVMAYWGEAMTYTHALWNQDDRNAAQAALAKLGSTPQVRAANAATERERQYLAAAEKLFGDGTLLERDTAFLSSMAVMAKAYPQDDEAQLFHALALLGVTRGNRDIANYLEAAEISRRVFARNPQHPGAAHYWIHGMDDPEHAAGALDAARALAKIAPGAGHAQHMTSHIFMARGMWQDVIDANLNAINVVAAERRQAGEPMAHCGHYPEWLQYGYYQAGRPQDAQKLLMQCIDDIAAAVAWYNAHPDVKDAAGAAVAGRLQRWQNSAVFMRAMAVIESETNRTQNAAVALKVSGNGRIEGWDDFARGFAAARRGTAAEASKYLDALRAVSKLPSTKNEMPRTTDYLNIMELMLEAVIAQGAGQADVAIATARDAAKRYDEMPFDFGPPVPVKPPHELAGELLLQAGSPKEAVTEFDLALRMAPGRALSLQGRANALAAISE